MNRRHAIGAVGADNSEIGHANFPHRPLLNEADAGDASFIPFLARAAAAVGIDALFCEVHDDPATAKSDGPNALDLALVERVLRQVLAIDAVTRGA